MMAEEGCKRKQTAREKFINEGDENTRYFHLIAKGRKRRVKILSLLHEGASMDDVAGINKIATSFYKELFGPSISSSINFTNLTMNQLSNVDRSLLTAPFCINEIKKVVFDLKHNSALGPAGFPAEFFQDFWELIYLDIWNLFKDFYDGNLDIERLNYGMALCIKKVISESQYGFIQGRYIMDGVVSLNEILPEVKRKKHSGVVLKIDFEKAYDKVNWHFLYCIMEKKDLGVLGVIGL
jgi:hypothetical protein